MCARVSGINRLIVFEVVVEGCNLLGPIVILHLLQTGSRMVKMERPIRCTSLAATRASCGRPGR